MSLAKTEKRLEYLYYKKLMLEIKFKEHPTEDSRDKYEAICEDLDDALSKLYSDFIMELRESENSLFDVYIALPRYKVKNNLLSGLISEWTKKKKEYDPIQKQNFNIHTELKK